MLEGIRRLICDLIICQGFIAGMKRLEQSASKTISAPGHDQVLGGEL